MLFSEPKIPQFAGLTTRRARGIRFSALQRAENSSTYQRCHSPFIHPVSVLFSEPKIPQGADRGGARRGREFQCSSASRKFLNHFLQRLEFGIIRSFSALQRAENSSTIGTVAEPVTAIVSVLFSEPKIPQKCAAVPLDHPISFQCSSASRKFLNN